VPEAEHEARCASSYGIFAGKANKTAVLRFTPRASGPQTGAAQLESSARH
jgi:hypothetical protein